MVYREMVVRAQGLDSFIWLGFVSRYESQPEDRVARNREADPRSLIYQLYKRIMNEDRITRKV